MSTLLEVHFAFAFFVLLLAVTVGWVQLGRRVLIAVIGMQILIGAVVAVWAAAAGAPMPAALWMHVAGAFVAMFAYIAGRRVFERANGANAAAIALSLLGFIVLVFTAWYGTNLLLHHPLVHAS